ncbi:aminotransferase class I/II-fold pyridoxal phosphate-dependent enzyme [Paenibacillus sp. 32352]|uniref:aminotransferase class I/II-fold pyridoxal phosphate-dependent enzyme n=1 Tax=Paenibacillus sp. 32352 TaxID=1969111 RepID=UPI0009ABF2D1|nr:aminotransferase class I/II-fold pyridoxal phosphate-dependent enzyme [Paenibacillus sp. 32352]
MAWKPDTLSDVPLFRQIYMHYEQEIIRGTLLPGDPLPTERELAFKLGINRSTVSAAYEELKAMGLVQSVQGSGTRVCESMWDETPSRTPNWERYSYRRPFDPTSPIVKRTISAFAHPGIINLTKGELSPDLMPLDLLHQLASEIDFSLPFSYYANFKGDFELRQALSELLQSHLNLTADPSQILITAGVKHALHLISHTLLQPGDAVAVEGPSYLAGGFYVGLKVKRRGWTDKELLAAGIREGVIVSSGTIYGADRGFIRLTYASVDEDLITEGLVRLGKALRQEAR